MFLIIAEYGPNSYVPKLVRYYEGTLILTALSLTLFIMDKCLKAYTINAKPNKWIVWMINAKGVRFWLGLDVTSVWW